MRSWGTQIPKPHNDFLLRLRGGGVGWGRGRGGIGGGASAPTCRRCLLTVLLNRFCFFFSLFLFIANATFFFSFVFCFQSLGGSAPSALTGSVSVARRAATSSVVAPLSCSEGTRLGRVGAAAVRSTDYSHLMSFDVKY